MPAAEKYVVARDDKGVKGDAVDVIAEAMKGPASSAAGGALDMALEAAKWTENPEQIVDIAAAQLVKGSNFLEKIKAAASAR